MSDKLLDVLLWGDTTHLYINHTDGWEEVHYDRLSYPGDQYIGPNMPRPKLQAYRGYDGPYAKDTWFWDDSQWRNCFDEMQVWEG